MAGFWGKHRKEREQAQAEHDADLQRRAEHGLVAADEQIRHVSDEHAFALAELGETATADLAAALTSVRTHMGEAFRLHQLNHDDIPDTAEELRTRNARIVQLCDWAQQLLREKLAALEQAIARARQAPAIIAQVRAQAQQQRERLTHAHAAIARLSERYAENAMAPITANADEAEQLLDFADHGIEVSDRRRADRRIDESNLALQTATEAVRRAETILDAVDSFEIEALRAESTLARMVQMARDHAASTAASTTGASDPRVDEALTHLNNEIAVVSATERRRDPFGDLARLREAGTRVNHAVATAQYRLQNPLPSVEYVQIAVDDADRHLAVARNLIHGHSGWIGADARTRLAEAERLRTDVPSLIESEDTREQALGMAQRIAYLAHEALQLAQRDIDYSRPRAAAATAAGGNVVTHPGAGAAGAVAASGTANTGAQIAVGILGALVAGRFIGKLFD